MAYLGAARKTLTDIVNGLCVATSFDKPTDVSASDAAPSTDPVILKMVKAVEDAAIWLLDQRPWQEFCVSANLSVVAETPGQVERAYDLPADFHDFFHSTQNDATMRRPAVGSVTNARWQSIQALSPQVTFQLMWRYARGQIWFLYPPSAAHSFSYEYKSRALWKVGNDTYDTPVRNDAQCLMDPVLVEARALVVHLERSGFDASAAARDLDNLMALRAPKGEGYQPLNLAARPGTPLVGVANLPQTGYGGV